MFSAILGFVVCAAIIYFSGRKLSYFGDLLAKKTGIGGLWIGLILMAAITSLPEVTLGISSVAIVGSPDLAVGGVLGSCVFNLTILSLLDVVSPGTPILTRVTGSHILAVSLTSILLTLVGVGLFLPDDFIVIGWIGISSVAFVAIYFITIRLMYRLEKKNAVVTDHAEAEIQNTPIKSVLLWYAFYSLLIIGAGLLLPTFASRIALLTGWGDSFVGTVLLAASSSFPEMAVAIASAKIGAIDMAVGNLFGSNMFNIFTLAIDDLFYRNGYLLKDASEVHLITVFAVVIMNSIIIVSLILKPSKKRFIILAWDTLLILLLYLGSMWLILQMK